MCMHQTLITVSEKTENTYFYMRVSAYHMVLWTLFSIVVHLLKSSHE